MDAYNQIFGDKKVVMVVMAHPDDLDAYCGATVARLVADGKKVISLKLTSGDRGSKGITISSEELAAKREAEDKRAMECLGLNVDDSFYLQIPDGEVENNLETIGKISYYIRKFQPQIVITTNPEKVIIRRGEGVSWVNHRDHRKAAQSAIDAVYPYSRDRSFFTEQFKEQNLQPGCCREFLIADYWDEDDDAFIKVDDFIDNKRRALNCHGSQMSKSEVEKLISLSTKHSNLEPNFFEKFRYIKIDEF